MAESIRIFMSSADETAFLRFLARFELEVYPVRIPPAWKPFVANEDAIARLPAEAAYLAATQIGETLVDRVKRGPDKGLWRVDEVRSPVIFFERSRTDENGELLSGKLWAELDVTPQTGRRDAAPDRFRGLFLEIQAWLKKTYRSSEPKGFLIGPDSARRFKQGLVLRNAEHRGGTVQPYR